MRWIFLLLTLTLTANAQPPTETGSGPNESTTQKKVDPKVHADAIRLVEASGVKLQLQENFRQMVGAGAKLMVDRCPRCTPEFADEWKKRFIEQSNLQDYLDVYVRVYEKYFTDSEINELISIQKDKSTPNAPAPSPALKKKLTSVMPDVLADSEGECAKIGAKLGSKIGIQIEREHPEYINTPPSENKP